MSHYRSVIVPLAHAHCVCHKRANVTLTSHQERAYTTARKHTHTIQESDTSGQKARRLGTANGRDSLMNQPIECLCIMRFLARGLTKAYRFKDIVAKPMEFN